MNVFNGVPSGISTRPVLLILPTSENTFVPALFVLPISLNHAGPFDTIGATLYQVSTLLDRKSTRLNSSHLGISYAVFCLKKKETQAQYRKRPVARPALRAVRRLTMFP